MWTDHDAVDRMASLLRKLREDRRISQLQLADHAGVNASVVHRAELGRDCRLSTWNKLFEGLGYRLLFDATEDCEEAEALLSVDAAARQARRNAF